MTDSVKVLLTRPDGQVEMLWAISRGNDRYVLDNLPWFAYGVSAGDVFEASPDELGMLVFRRIVHKSANRTVRIVLDRIEGTDQMSPASQHTLEQLRAAGCDYEGMHRDLFAINVPPAVALDTVADILIASGFELGYADPTYEELHPDSAGQDGKRDA